MRDVSGLRVAIWCAVSSRAQAAEDKASLEDQERRGREFAGAVGGEVVAVYSVPGHSRDYVLWSDAERDIPAYGQLRQDVEKHRFDVLHVIDMDRLGRTLALSSQVVALVERSGAEVYDASAPLAVENRMANISQLGLS